MYPLILPRISGIGGGQIVPKIRVFGPTNDFRDSIVYGKDWTFVPSWGNAHDGKLILNLWGQFDAIGVKRRNPLIEFEVIEK